MKILLISTGGTIASKQGADGLAPVVSGHDLALLVPDIYRMAEIDICDVFSKDSTNICPNDWISLEACITSNGGNYDGFVITHGTDTMAYTSSILSYTLRHLGKPVILTGSVIPISSAGSDARKNLRDSFLFMGALLDKGQEGVSVAFDGRLIHGPRAKKISGRRLDAFRSIGCSDIGRIEDGTAIIYGSPFIDKTTLCGSYAAAKFSNDVIPIKIFPGLKSEFFMKLIDMAPAAVVVEGFGLGGIPYMGEDLLPGLERAAALGVIAVMTTQCPEGGVDLTVYDVGQKALKAGAVSAQDMGFEAVITKLMWLLPLLPRESVKDMLTHNFCDEIDA